MLNSFVYVFRIGLVVVLSGMTSFVRAEEPEHPSLLFNLSDIEELKHHVKSGWMKDAFRVMHQQADEFLNKSTNPYSLNGAKSSGRVLNNLVSTLALTGWISGEERYCKKAVDILVAWASQSDVDYFVELNHHLSVGDGAHAYAMGYDWLWVYMTEEERALIRNEILSFGGWLYDHSMEGRGYGDYSQQNLSCNHNTVMHGGLGLCALALGDDCLTWRDRAERFVRGYLEHARDKTGYNFEGIGYYAYGSWGTVPFGVALERAGHSDIFSGVESLSQVPNYVLRQMVPSGEELVSMNDSPNRLGSSGGFMYLLSRFQSHVGLWAWLKLYGKEGDGYFGSYESGYLGDAASIPYTLLFADPALEPVNPADIDLPLHTFFERGSASLRSGWGDLDAMATFTCGYDLHRGHNQRDENSFTFFARGERFAIDPGYDPVSSRCHNTVLVDGQGQGCDEGEYDVNGKIESVQEFDSAWAISGNATDAFPEVLQLKRARRQFLFVNADIPYLVIADDLERMDAKTTEYTWLLHTDRMNKIGVDKRENTAYIKGSRRGAICMVRFVNPVKGLEISETNLKNEFFEGNGKTYKSAQYYKELRAECSAKIGRFITVIAAADQMDDLPEIRCKGGPTDMRLAVKSSDGRVDTVHITPETIDFEKGHHK